MPWPVKANQLQFRLASSRHDWRLEEVEALFDLPFMDLMFRAQQVHRAAPRRRTACR